jgi:hypothetical protein
VKQKTGEQNYANKKYDTAEHDTGDGTCAKRCGSWGLNEFDVQLVALHRNPASYAEPPDRIQG